MGGDAGEAEAVEVGVDVLESGVVSLDGFLEVFGVVEGGEGGVLGYAADVEGGADAVCDVPDFGVSDGVTEAEACEAVGFAEGAGDDEVWVLG